MAVSDQCDSRNLLLKALPAESFDMLSADAEIIPLALKQVLVKTDQPNDHVCSKRPRKDPEAHRRSV
ncbi:hypothetical protein [Rhizobium binae]|uniref:Uncharacterized protein n=1 Tax=Rhizobium binae TaxID=1138190 RepID=A0ABV2MQ22_9HYPH|nr:hypothetical protein [Rhizobium binae]NKL51652.1 hypothetical protein [Rhizobium leguminosarum bv. viciae]MBX4926309.1 hypothetical protein [Rhizobium binae]MBX4936457.1 hypothetical protein [Rhizobium binae]MBX4942780.1 hypothetical protein [Rhizobium binae]MBX4949771.1 hypothetical protein [Rhizobium binae]